MEVKLTELMQLIGELYVETKILSHLNTTLKETVKKLIPKEPDK